MSANKGVKTIVGGGVAQLFKKTDDSDTIVPEYLSLLSKYDIYTIDSAVTYGDANELLGVYGAAEQGFTLDTKIPGGINAGSCDEEGAYKIGKEAITKMRTKQADILYIHTPDTTVPIASTLAGIDKLHKEGLFRRLGLSNFSPEQVQEAYDVAKEKGYVLPTVYQGNYNAFARRYEAQDNLLPLLRKLNMSFYAYSPTAGGFLAKTPSTIFTSGSRFDEKTYGPLSKVYQVLYSDKKALIDGLKKWNEIADQAGIKPYAMAVRWVKYNSALRSKFGDAIIIAGKMDQIEDSLQVSQQGPLPDSVVQKIDELWNDIKDDAPVDNGTELLRIFRMASTNGS